MELRQIRYALAVAEDLHFGRAAERLLVAQPSLSRQIRALERELGVELFTRTSRRVELTPAGDAFVESARQTLAAAENTRSAALAAASGAVGVVALGFVASAAIQVLPALLELHREHAPAVRLRLREMHSEMQIEALHTHEIDVGLTRDLPPTSGLTVTPLFREPLLAVVPRGHPLHRRRSVDAVELAASEFVALPRALAPRAWNLLAAMAHERRARLRFAQEAHQYATLLALVAAGVGVAVVPASVRALRSAGVHYLQLRDTGAWSEVQAAIREGETMPAARNLHRLMEQRLRRDEADRTAAGPRPAL